MHLTLLVSNNSKCRNKHSINITLLPSNIHKFSNRLDYFNFSCSAVSIAILDILTILVMHINAKRGVTAVVSALYCQFDSAKGRGRQDVAVGIHLTSISVVGIQSTN